MLIDTHIHLYSRKFDADREQVVMRAREAGVEMLVLPAIDVATIRQAVELARQFDGVYAMAALHPTETNGATDEDLDAVREWCSDPHVVAVGESGLDYYWDRSFDQTQRDFFRRHAELAIEVDLPLILHSREKKNTGEVQEHMVRILQEVRAASAHPERLRGIFHCFGGPDWLPEEAASLQFLLGVGGTLTFKNSGVDALVAEVPLSQIVLETDAPYLAPVPHRGKRNEPAHVRIVAEKLAEVKGVPVAEVEQVTTETARRLYKI